MNRASVWREFNACQFFVSSCLLIFSILYACRKESLIHWPYWVIFFPLFIWKSLAILGAIIGIFTYCCIRPRNRDRHSPIQCRALFLSLIESILLLCFELLICYNLEQTNSSEHPLTWIVCFLPLIILSIISVFTYVWLLRHGRSWEIQALFVVNILQFIFFALKLDNSIITWNYAAVFIPLWIVMSISIIFCIGRIIWTLIHYYRNDLSHLPVHQQPINRKYCQILASPTVGHLCILCFLLLFQILLVFYLEQNLDLSFLIVCLPLYIAFILLIYMSFNSRVPANHWWFGLRQDICSWLLHLCPIFETYANIEYHFPASSVSDSPRSSLHRIDSRRRRTSNPLHTRRFFFHKKTSSFSDPTKTDPCENELLTTILSWMDTSRYIQSCNPGRFVITVSLLIFSILFALQRDEYIRINYWLVFLPLFIWKMLVVFGACTGVFFWCKNGERDRWIRRPDNDCRALIMFLFLHLLIFIFEILICDKLQNRLDTRWIVCFIPIFFCTFLAFLSCLWSLKVQRNFLIQAFLSANGLFFLFFALRLDSLITWRYVVVFIPLWISLCIALLFVLSKLILAIIHHCSRRLAVNQRESSTIVEAVLYATIFIPFTLFAILLVERLDQNDQQSNGKISFTVIAIPLWISLIAWLLFSFGANDGNPWWFGLRRDLCEIILSQCPVISLYFNNQFKFAPRPSTTVPMNDIILDVTTSTGQKNLESMNMNKLSAIDMANERTLVSHYNFVSLLEPD